jgi:hypothetical protein
MTVLVGITHNGVTWIGADGAASTGYFVSTMVEPKVWEQGAFLIAGTGALRELQIIQHRVTLPTFNEDSDLLRYLVVDFANVVRQARKDSGFEEKHANGTEASPGLLIGYAGRLFDMDSGYAVSEHKNFAVHGCGRDLAYGSLHTSAKIWTSPRKRIEAALNAACSVNAYCKPPFTILRTP